MPREVVPILPSGASRSQLNHPVVRQNDVRPIADDQAAIHLHAGAAPARNLLSRATGSSHNALPITLRQPGRRMPQGTSMKDEFFPG